MDTADEQSPRKRQKCCNSCDAIAVGRISDLPERIFGHILSFLPSQSAVATSLLSKKWRFRWTEVTSFDFDDQWYANPMNFEEFVTLFMGTRRAISEYPIHKFHLRWSNPIYESFYLNIWLDIAIAQKVRVVDLNLLSSRSAISLPYQLYACTTLEVLKLKGPFLVKVPQEVEVCLPKLVVFEIKLVYLGSGEESFHEIISQSFFLSKLLDIGRKIWIVDLSLLSSRLVFYSSLCLPHEFFTCKTLEVLKLIGPFRLKVPPEVEVCLPKLVVLELKNIYFESEEESLHKLICGCPVLQTLIIERKLSRSFYSAMVNWSFSSSVLKHLEIFFHDDCSWRFSRKEHYKLKLDVPALEKLVISGRLGTEISISGGLSSVNEADLDVPFIEDVMDWDYPNSIIQLIEDLNHVKILKLSERTMEFLSKASSQVQRRSLWSTSFERLTKLVVKFDYFSQWSCLVNLSNRCPALEILEITKLPGRFSVAERIVRRFWGIRFHWSIDSVPKSSLSRLNRVSYKGYTGLDDEMSMLMSFLSPAILAKKVDLRTDFSDDSPNFELRFSFV